MTKSFARATATTMTTIVRFAPSPTGRIHIGNSRVAILNWLFAKKSGGQFILRYDDTDTARSTKEFETGIATDIAWLGITPDRVEWQSKRFAHYDQLADGLRNSGHLYPCYETADELDRRRKRQQARGVPPVYDRAGTEPDARRNSGFYRPGPQTPLAFQIVSYDG